MPTREQERKARADMLRQAAGQPVAQRASGAPQNGASRPSSRGGVVRTVSRGSSGSGRRGAPGSRSPAAAGASESKHSETADGHASAIRGGARAGGDDRRRQDSGPVGGDRRLRWSERARGGRPEHDRAAFNDVRGSETLDASSGVDRGLPPGATDRVRAATMGRIDGRGTARRAQGNKQREADAVRQERRAAAILAQKQLGPLPDLDDVGSSDTDSTFTVDRDEGLTQNMPGALGTVYGGDYTDKGGVGGAADLPHQPRSMAGVLLGGNGASMPGMSETRAAQQAAQRAADLLRGKPDASRDIAKARKAALQQKGSAVQPMGLPFRGRGTGSDYGGFPPGYGFPERGRGPRRGGLGRVTGAADKAIPGTFETEAARQARLMAELLPEGGLDRIDPRDRSRRVQESALAGALRSSANGAPVGRTETSRTYGRGGLGGVLGDGSRQAGAFRPPRSDLTVGGGFMGNTTTGDAGSSIKFGDGGINQVGHRGPGQRSMRPGRVVPLMEGTMKARRTRLHDDEGMHVDRTTIRTPAQAIETRVRRADREDRRLGADGLPLDASLHIAVTAVTQRAKAASAKGALGASGMGSGAALSLTAGGAMSLSGPGPTSFPHSER